MNNIVQSASYLEFINDIDNLINKFLYSDEGYCSCISRDAVKNVNVFVDKFNYELNNIRLKVDFNNADEIVNCKREEFLKTVKKHYDSQVLTWADEVYQNIIDNCLFKVSCDKSDENCKKYYKEGLEVINWITMARKFPLDTKEAIIKKFKNDFFRALKSTDSDYIIQRTPENSDKKLFLKLRNLVIEDYKTFIKLDFSAYIKKLSQNDINILNRYKDDLKSYRSTQLIDEINLINSAIKILNIADNDKIYDFIKQVENDFSYNKVLKKNLDEQTKINIVKRRIELCDKKSKNGFEYFKKMLTFSSLYK